MKAEHEVIGMPILGRIHQWQKALVLAFAVIWPHVAFAADTVPMDKVPTAFTQEELRDLASTYVAVLDHKLPHDILNAIKVSQFYGYVMGYLDAVTGDPKEVGLYVECASKSPKTIVLRTAKSILFGQLNRSESVRFTFVFALGWACNEKAWK